MFEERCVLVSSQNGSFLRKKAHVSENPEFSSEKACLLLSESKNVLSCTWKHVKKNLADGEIRTRRLWLHYRSENPDIFIIHKVAGISYCNRCHISFRHRTDWHKNSVDWIDMLCLWNWQFFCPHQFFHWVHELTFHLSWVTNTVNESFKVKFRLSTLSFFPVSLRCRINFCSFRFCWYLFIRLMKSLFLQNPIFMLSSDHIGLTLDLGVCAGFRAESGKTFCTCGVKHAAFLSIMKTCANAASRWKQVLNFSNLLGFSGLRNL